MIDCFIDLKTRQTLTALANEYTQARAAGWLAEQLQPLIDAQQAKLTALQPEAAAAAATFERVAAETNPALHAADGEARTAAGLKQMQASQQRQTKKRRLAEAQARLDDLKTAQQVLSQAAQLPDAAALRSLDFKTR